jgi:DNA-binding MarR family transcriptional regulator
MNCEEDAVEDEEFQSAIDTIARQCIASRVQELNRVVTRIYDEALRPCGITAGQLNMLVAIAHMGEARPGALSEMFHMDVSTLSRNVDRMRLKGWLTAGRGQDGRTVLLSLTTQGRDLVGSAAAAWRRAQDQAGDLLGPNGVSMLRQVARAARGVEIPR